MLRISWGLTFSWVTGRQRCWFYYLALLSFKGTFYKILATQNTWVATGSHPLGVLVLSPDVYLFPTDLIALVNVSALCLSVWPHHPNTPLCTGTLC
jgi:hypothetical protein